MDNKDGTYAVKVDGKHQIEIWSGGKRVSYTPISEEKFNDLKRTKNDS